jgi:hypothetical protein
VTSPLSLFTRRLDDQHTGHLFSRTRFQCFLRDPPLSSFKKLILSTPRLVQGLRTMSLAKAVPEGIKDRECKRFALRERPLVPYMPEKVSSKKWFPFSRESQDYHRGRCGTTHPNLALQNARDISHACKFSPQCNQETGTFKAYKEAHKA